MKRLILIAALVLAASVAQACDDETIQTNQDGIITTIEGNAYQAHSESDVTTWLPSEDVLTCGDKLINKDSDGESADVDKLN